MSNYKLKDGSTLMLDSTVINKDGVSVTVRDRDGKSDRFVMDAGINHALNIGLMDADGAVFFQRELEHIKAKSYDVLYANLKARQVFPVSSEAGAGATTITYRTYDMVGSAKILNSYAGDLPRADIAGKETTIPLVSVGISYGYNIDEIAAAQMTGLPLDQRRANAAMRSNEQVVNDVAFYGDAESGLPGLFTDPNIPIGNVVDPGAGTEWVNKTPDQILFDVNDIYGDIFETTKMVEKPTDLLIPPQQHNYIRSTPRSANSDTTILSFLLTHSGFSTIEPMNECLASENPEIATDAMVAYDKNPDKLQLEIPLELEMLAVQIKNLEFVVPGRSRLGGLNIYYPLSLAIALGI